MKIIRLLFAVAVFAAFLFAGTDKLWAQAEAKLNLAATVKGVANGTPVHLLSSSMQGWSVPPAAVDNGKFTLSVALPQPDLFSLVVGNPSDQKAMRIQLFLANEVVEIAIDAVNNGIEIISGPSPVAFSELMNSFGPQFDALSNLARQRQQAGNAGYYSDSLSKAWDMQLNKISGMIPSYLQKHGGSPVAAFLLNTVWQLYNNVSQMDGWIASLKEPAKKSIFFESLDQQMQTERLLGMGQVAPEFVQNDPEGKPVSLKDFRGKYVLIDFWASWCGPCRMENPNVVQAYQRFKHKNFVVLGVSLDKDKPRWLQAIKDDNLTWPHVSDLRFWQNEVAKLYQVSSIPQNYLLDPEGRIIGKNLRGQALDNFLEKTLGAH